ncbi:universal stress protein [Rhodococcus coprophilus]|uniref:Universal stress protein family n=1 Tax=Rhodococcus coprophilus TaxID=38310 RepID=A0A2X4WXE7_9NOCA|nr:universal stress protein [Rhodococcus coprophilus]MBM7460992.1 nucleotide-binding universal stress UspA family protein [Rhodococcus coprophilus]SQI28794.1 Universal stress protein family [Rhodococcus coprophilus]
MNWTVIAVFVVVWVLVGLLTGLWMARRGHDGRWTIIAVVLGPLFVPIAYERVERTPRPVEVTPVDSWGADPANRSGLRVMVGYDGSVEAEHALASALKLFGRGGGVLELVAVVSYDDASGADSTMVDRAKHRLNEAASGAGAVPTGYAVLAGPPGQCLRWYAENHRADVLVVGKRGRGMTTRMLGSVAEYLTAHCPVPVLVVDPTVPPEPTDSAEPTVALRVSSDRAEKGPESN